MSHIRKNIQTAIHYETIMDAEKEMDEYLHRAIEQNRKNMLQQKIAQLANMENYDEIIIQNRQNGIIQTQTALRDVRVMHPTYKKLNRLHPDVNETIKQTI